MSGWRYKLYRFMQGRRGIDNFSKFLIITAIVLLIASMFMGKVPVAGQITYYAGFVIFIYGYFRTFSRNLYKREKENNKFMALKYKLTKGKTMKQRREERKFYAYFHCPGCGQKMRAPKGKGTIQVKCHRCETEFQKTV